jgi:hypothetical protein
MSSNDSTKCCDRDTTTAAREGGSEWSDYRGIDNERQCGCGWCRNDVFQKKNYSRAFPIPDQKMFPHT